MELTRTRYNDKDFQELIKELDAEFWVRYPDTQQNFVPFNTVDDTARVVVVYESGRAIGCGCFRPMKGEESTAEIKRMYVRPTHRSRGIGKLILAALEAWAVEENFLVAKLETGNKQPEAVRAYEQSGYQRIPNFEPYVNVALSICMMKRLA